jgi:hypothetical protein
LIPPLNEHGYLPPGVHRATLDEVIQRFGHGSEQREAQADSLRWLVPLCRDAGIFKFLINGSFVTDVLEPTTSIAPFLCRPTMTNRNPLRNGCCSECRSLRSSWQMLRTMRGLPQSCSPLTVL